MKRHPRREQLFAFAESVTESRPNISDAVAGHVRSCPRCRDEVKRIRATLRAVRAASEETPSNAFQARMMMQVREAQRKQRERAALFRAWTAWGKGLAYATVLLVLAGVSFGGASTPGVNMRDMPDNDGNAPEVAMSAGPSHDELHKTVEQVRALSEAVRARVRDRVQHAGGSWEEDYERVVLMLDADVEEALAALRRNPGNPRASDLVNASLERQAQTLKSLYMGRRNL